MNEMWPTAPGVANENIRTSGEATRPVALVTGGGVRVGRAIALGLIDDGYDLMVSCRHSVAGAEEVAEAGRERGARIQVVEADLGSEAGAVQVARAVRESFGRLDLLVNSAASFVANDLLRITAAEWDRVMAVNLRAPFLLVRETADLLCASGAAVVNIVDLSALHPWTSHPHHSVSKAALLHLTRVMARRLAPQVRVNAIAPGDVLPPEHWTAPQVEAAHRRVPLGKRGKPGDVVAAVRMLVGARYLTGQVVVVDGGAGGS